MEADGSILGAFYSGSTCCRPMPQASFVIGNHYGNQVRADINDALAAILSSNSGGTAPTNKVAGTLWLDTTTGGPVLKVWTGTAWVPVVTGNSNHVDVSGLVKDTEFEGLLELVFPETLSRTFGLTISGSGQAIVSTGNPAQFGSTTFIGISRDTDGGLLDDIETDDGIVLQQGTSAALFATVANSAVDPTDSSVQVVWVRDIAWSKGLDAYDDFPTGAGKIRFRRSRYSELKATLKAGSGITITTDDTAKTITVAAN